MLHLTIGKVEMKRDKQLTNQSHTEWEEYSVYNLSPFTGNKKELFSSRTMDSFKHGEGTELRGKLTEIERR